MRRDQFVAVILRIQVQQVALLAQHFAALVELAHGDADIVALGNHRRINQFLRSQVDAVDMAQGRQEGDDDRR